MKKMKWLLLVLSSVFLLILSACGTSQKSSTSDSAKVSTEANGQKTAGTSEIKLGYATCAHCLAMSLIPNYVKNVKVDAENFPSGNDVLTALVSGSLDVAQVTYLHYITALDKGLDLVAISGQINGGSEILVGNNISLKADDWAGFKKLVDERKNSGKKLKVAASRGNAQDIHMRGEFMKHGIDPVKDIEFINIANPADHASALANGQVDVISTVEPFASQIRMNHTGKHFAFPYDQAAGNLTNLIVTRSDVIKKHKAELQEVVTGGVKLVDDLKHDNNKWLDVISKKTSLSKEIGKEALKNSSPDYNMHEKETLAIAKMMKDLNYIQNDVTEKAAKNMDYEFLVKATGKTAKELGKE
jgi:ABC-type nitrate/sulfonate/bicarbonate transport system substrate-binding protein